MPKKKALTYLDVAEVWPGLAAADRARRLKQLPPDAAPEFFFDLSAADQVEVLLMLPPAERRLWIRLLKRLRTASPSTAWSPRPWT